MEQERQIVTRIAEHPVLGTFEKGKKVDFTFDGQPLEGFEGRAGCRGAEGGGCCRTSVYRQAS